MILLNSGTTSTIALSLKESLTITGVSYYLFKFYNDDQEEKIFTAPDISTHQDRVNIFEIELVNTIGDENLFFGQIFINQNKKWRYRIYQSTSPFFSDIVPFSNEYAWLEEGIVWIKNIYSEPDKKSYTPNITKKTYKQ